jgi:hypothetical protein
MLETRFEQWPTEQSSRGQQRHQALCKIELTGITSGPELVHDVPHGAEKYGGASVCLNCKQT